MSPTRITKSELIALLAILLLAAGLRFAYPGVSSFAMDEAHISLDALRMARGGEFVMAGQPSSVDIPFFPASVWLFALPYAVSPDPLVATWLRQPDQPERRRGGVGAGAALGRLGRG